MMHGRASSSMGDGHDPMGGASARAWAASLADGGSSPSGI